jgi:hypothetical protein
MLGEGLELCSGSQRADFVASPLAVFFGGINDLWLATQDVAVAPCAM